MVRAEFFRAGFSVAVVIVLQLFSTSGLKATVLRYLPLDRQCAEARIIAVARAEDQVSAWNPEKTRIYTETRFTLEEVLKGKVSSSLTVRQLGGRVGDIAQSVAGSPVFVKGRRYVLFLAPLADGKYRIVGFSQGCYPIVSDQEGKERISPQLSSAAGVHIVGRDKKVMIGSISLQEFLAKVRLNLENNPE